jgi:hypothetical protein
MATLTTWRLTRDHTSPSTWAAREERRDWVLVTHPADTRAVRLPLPSRSDTTVNVSFDESGALTSFTSDVTGRGAERVQALSALPAALRDASKAGSELASVFSPAAARVAALKQRVEELETRSKWQGLLNPAQDNLAELRQELTEAELQARLALAQRVAQDPSSVVVSTPIPTD